jgi:predicted nuclease with TOPRIM domain
MDGANRNPNIDRLFSMMEELLATTNGLRGEISVIGTKVNESIPRLERLEKHDEKRLEREERVSVLLAKLEGRIDNSSRDVSDLQQRIEKLEGDVLIAKTNWKWLAGLTTALGGIAGFIANTIVKLFN